jgi:hypothetical protein
MTHFCDLGLAHETNNFLGTKLLAGCIPGLGVL